MSAAKASAELPEMSSSREDRDKVIEGAAVLLDAKEIVSPVLLAKADAFTLINEVEGGTPLEDTDLYRRVEYAGAWNHTPTGSEELEALEVALGHVEGYGSKALRERFPPLFPPLSYD